MLSRRLRAAGSRRQYFVFTGQTDIFDGYSKKKFFIEKKGIGRPLTYTGIAFLRDPNRLPRAESRLSIDQVS
jgi:hypothetical protein